MKKQTLYALTFIMLINYTSQALGMDYLRKIMVGSHESSQTITRPYAPGISARYPLSSGIVKSGLLAGLSYVASKYSQNINPKYVAAATFFTSAAYYLATKKSNILDSLLVNPLKQLNQNYITQNQIGVKFAQENLNEEFIKTSDAKTITDAYEKITKQFETNNPIFFLGECTQEDWGACSLSRSYRPEHRETFEKETIKALLEKTNATDEPIQYVSFGTGGMFQDLVIMVKTLVQKPNARIVIHFIDQKYALYEGVKDLLGTREVFADQTIDPTTVMADLMLKAVTEGGLSATTPNLEKELTITPIIEEIKFKQFIGYLQKKFPKAQTSLHVHSQTKSYFKYLDEKNMTYADVITTADIQDEMSSLARSINNYTILCTKTLEHKPTSKNIWLSKKTGTDEAALCAITLQPTTDGTDKEKEFNLSDILNDNQFAACYANVTDIPATSYPWLNALRNKFNI